MDHFDEPTQALPADDLVDAPDADESAPGDAPSADGGEDRRPGPTILTWVLSGVLVVALFGAIGWFAMTTSRQGREAAMRATATSFLQAIADADADAALGRLAEAPANRALLSDAALTASREAAPLTEIEAGALGGTEDAPTVDVTYRLGDQPVATTLTLEAAGPGWRIVNGTTNLTVPERRGLTVNGVEVTEEVNPVFPGTYTATPSSPFVALAGEPTVTVTTPGQDGATIAVTVGLSERGTQTVLNAVKGRYDECLAATESRPAGCPFGVATDNVDVAEGSVRFTLVNDPWASFAPTLDPATLVASGTVTHQINATATVTRNGLTTEAMATLNQDRGYSVDLTKDPAVVTWS